MKVILKIFLLVLFICFCSSQSQLYAASLVAICTKGDVKGIRTEYTKENGFKVSEEKVSLSSLIYKIDSPKKNMVEITYGNDEIIGSVIKRYDTYVTVVYVYSGVPYMDTIFFNDGIIFSTEHKDLFAYKSTTWRLKCIIEK